MSSLRLALLLLPVLAVGLPGQSSPSSFNLADALLGSSHGEIIGGELTAEGYRPNTPDGHLLYRLSDWPPQGLIEVELRGMQADTAGDHAFLALYDGRGITEPARYFGDFRENYFRLNVHWRVERQAMKAVVTCAAPTAARLNADRAVFLEGEPRDFTAEPTGATVSWDPRRWHHLRLEWSPDHITVQVDGAEVWRTDLPLPYAPREPRLWLGCAPGHGGKYRNHVPQLHYRNLRISLTL